MPAEPSLPTSIDRHRLRELLDGGAQLVEVLPADEYAEEHLPGALSIPLKQLDANTAKQLDTSRPVAVYCWDTLCDMSPRAAWRLVQLGFAQVYDYTAGKIDWIAAGLRTEGPGPAKPRVLTAIDPNIPTCDLNETVGAVRSRLGPEITACVVINHQRIVAGRLEHLDTIDPEDPRPVSQVMRPGPTTIRPSDNLDDVRERMRARHASQLLVTTPDGELLGVLHAD
jgi:rhodanese-related sulfurtransferase